MRKVALPCVWLRVNKIDLFVLVLFCFVVVVKLTKLQITVKNTADGKRSRRHVLCPSVYQGNIWWKAKDNCWHVALFPIFSFRFPFFFNRSFLFLFVFPSFDVTLFNTPPLSPFSLFLPSISRNSGSSFCLQNALPKVIVQGISTVDRAVINSEVCFVDDE